MVEQEMDGLDIGEGAFGNCAKCKRDYDMDEHLICACPTIEQMIEEMEQVEVYKQPKGWSAFVWPAEAGSYMRVHKHESALEAIRALYEKWKEKG